MFGLALKALTEREKGVVDLRTILSEPARYREINRTETKSESKRERESARVTVSTTRVTLCFI